MSFAHLIKKKIHNSVTMTLDTTPAKPYISEFVKTHVEDKERNYSSSIVDYLTMRYDDVEQCGITLRDPRDSWIKVADDFNSSCLDATTREV